MFRIENWLAQKGKYVQPKKNSDTPAVSEAILPADSKKGNSFDPSRIEFEPYVPSSESESDNVSYDEDIVSVLCSMWWSYTKIDIDNLSDLDLDSEHSIPTSEVISPHIDEVRYSGNVLWRLVVKSILRLSIILF